MFKEFKEFAMRGSVVDLAVGVIIGGAFGKIVTSFVNDILMPPIGLLIGNVDFSELAVTLKGASGASKAVTLNYGLFINNVINFLIVAFSIFLVVKGMNNMKKKEPAPTPTEKPCPQCCMTIPLAAKRCGHCTAVIATILIFLSFSSARAEDLAPSPRPWKDAAELSVVSTNGNSKGTTSSAKNTFSYKWAHSALELIAGGLGSSSGNTVTAEQYNASEKVTRNFTEKNYVYEKTGWDKNRFAGYRNRWEGSAGLGRMLIDLPMDKLNGELGPGYVNEERINAPRNEFASGRAFAKYVHTLSATANFSQDAEYIHDFSDSKDYRLTTESAIIASMSTHLSLKASFLWKRVGKPPPGTVKDDTTTSVALIVNY